jgi:hypothetical protein
MLKVVGTEAGQDEKDGRSLLDEIAREGARRMIVAALEAEVVPVVKRDELRMPLLITGLLFGSLAFAGRPALSPSWAAPAADPDSTRMLAPPPAEGPVVVRASFALRDVNDIDDSKETFQFSGILRLTWLDPRQAFDPTEAGVTEKFYQASFSSTRAPRLVSASHARERIRLVREERRAPACSSRRHANPVRVGARDRGDRSRAASNALRCADAPGGLRGLRHGLVGGLPEVERATESRPHPTFVPQRHLVRTAMRTGDGSPPSWGDDGVSRSSCSASTSNASPLFMLRLVVLPLALIVALSWTVFWMDRSSLGDRISVSFVGILTAVAYQLVVADLMPDVSYVTLIHAFLNVSFAIMCASVVINLIVGAYDKAGRSDIGDIIDRRCRWAFPLVYAVLLVLSGIASRLLP